MRKIKLLFVLALAGCHDSAPVGTFDLLMDATCPTSCAAGEVPVQWNQFFTDNHGCDCEPNPCDAGSLDQCASTICGKFGTGCNSVQNGVVYCNECG